MNKLVITFALALSMFGTPVSAEALKTTAIGCEKAADAEKLIELLSHDRVAASAFSRPLLSSRSCLEFSKGVKIDVDQRRAPLACIRLPGDLSCYWMAAAFVDDHPGEKGSGNGKRAGGSRKH